MGRRFDKPVTQTRFTTWLAARLRESGLSVTAAAESAAITQAELSMLLHARRKPSIKTAKKLALALGARPEEALLAAGDCDPVGVGGGGVTPREVCAAVAAVKNGNVNERISAYRQFFAWYPELAGLYLDRAVHDPDAQVRLTGTELLGFSAQMVPETVDWLLELLDDPEIVVCQVAIKSLGALGAYNADERVARKLRKLTQRREMSPNIREVAEEALKDAFIIADLESADPQRHLRGCRSVYPTRELDRQMRFREGLMKVAYQTSTSLKARCAALKALSQIPTEITDQQEYLARRSRL